ncbi:manganese-dependent peroxidase [Artomyces pyxidatus]|uniref:Manganese-dependent peroxidase n=1 Tax=Artomyces pyxidatus TaxID=48021 RepID=A0ACB8SSZ2_9AGAM|nr:manganese-dependent peroxidase [Artomyces pyxidatus]
MLMLKISPYFPFATVWLLCARQASGASVPRERCASGGSEVSDLRCCQWFDVARDLQENLFSHSCEEDALEAIRLAFHDGVGRSRALEHNGTFRGGADGSILRFSEIELAYAENHAVDDIVHAIKPFADKHGVGNGDIVQFAAAIALSNCPGSPRLRFFSGRTEAKSPAPEHLVPSPASSASDILTRMDDAGFTSDELVALLAAHSIGRQRTLDSTRRCEGMALDSTPDAFDTQFYLDVMLKGTTYPGNGSHYGEALSPLKTQFRLFSDEAIARHPSTACTWQSFIDRQGAMMNAFAEAMHKLAVNGQDVESLVDCSEAIPSPPLQLWTTPVVYPPGTGFKNVERKCFDSAFPSLSSGSGS